MDWCHVCDLPMYLCLKREEHCWPRSRLGNKLLVCTNNERGELMAKVTIVPPEVPLPPPVVRIECSVEMALFLRGVLGGGKDTEMARLANNGSNHTYYSSLVGRGGVPEGEWFDVWGGLTKVLKPYVRN